MQDSNRAAARRVFLQRHALAQATVEPLAPDASFRRYFRVHDDARAVMLMDAPPPQENVSAFVRVAHHLAELGLRVAHVFAHDDRAGLVLLEDLGDATFTRLLDDGDDAASLYGLAVDVLGQLQTHPQATSIDLPRYDNQLLVEEVVRMLDWYYPGVRGETVPDDVREAFIELWRRLLESLPALAPTLVLRDFHVDNLIRVPAATGVQQCALLDFQDAVIGSPAYDLMSLLEDARRDVSPALADRMAVHYHDLAGTPDRRAFELHFHALAAQRHCKVLGNFARLYRRDGKAAYLAHVPRVVALLQRHLDRPILRPLEVWLDRHLPMRHTATVSAP